MRSQKSSSVTSRVSRMTESKEMVDEAPADAKVASIIDDYRVVINKGTTDGVTVGQRFLILNTGEEVFDPDTKESLGHIEVVKGKGEVTHVQEKMATLQTTDTHEIKRKASGLFAITQAAQEVSREPKAFIDPQIGDVARRL